jgi:hypothetical protein
MSLFLLKILVVWLVILVTIFVWSLSFVFGYAIYIVMTFMNIYHEDVFGESLYTAYKWKIYMSIILTLIIFYLCNKF